MGDLSDSGGRGLGRVFGCIRIFYWGLVGFVGVCLFWDRGEISRVGEFKVEV